MYLKKQKISNFYDYNYYISLNNPPDERKI